MRIKLKLLRVANNLSQAEMADKLKISRVHYGRLEKGQCEPTYTIMKNTAEAFPEAENILVVYENN